MFPWTWIGIGVGVGALIAAASTASAHREVPRRPPLRRTPFPERTAFGPRWQTPETTLEYTSGPWQALQLSDHDRWMGQSHALRHDLVSFMLPRVLGNASDYAYAIDRDGIVVASAVYHVDPRTGTWSLIEVRGPKNQPVDPETDAFARSLAGVFSARTGALP